MKMILKSALAAAAMAGAAAIIPNTANASPVGVSVGVAVPAPVVVVAPNGEGYSAYDEKYYYDPIYISGSWYHGPYLWKMTDGVRVFMVDGRWHRNEWRDNTYPATIAFHNGGHFGAGRHSGYADADRINARLRANNQDRREQREENRREDRQNASHDGGDAPKN